MKADTEICLVPCNLHYLLFSKGKEEFMSVFTIAQWKSCTKIEMCGAWFHAMRIEIIKYITLLYSLYISLFSFNFQMEKEGSKFSSELYTFFDYSFPYPQQSYRYI